MMKVSWGKKRQIVLREECFEIALDGRRHKDGSLANAHFKGNGA